MTFKELYDSVAQLGFEDSLENKTRFIQAANRAMYQINRIRPAISKIQISHHPLTNKVKNVSFETILKQNDFSLIAENVKSYYFECDGNGVAYIELYNTATRAYDVLDTITLTSNQKFVAYKGFIQNGEDFVTGSVRLRFSGNYTYCVRNVALYGDLFSDSEDDIPAFNAYTKYNIASLVTDYLRIAKPSIRNDADNSFLNTDYLIENRDNVLLPYNNKGVYTIFYERKLTILTNETNDSSNIDLDVDLAELLPILTAVYIWLDDEPNKASYYMELYREQEQKLLSKESELSPVVIKNTNRWA